MKKSDFVELLAYAENERDSLFLENSKLKDEIRRLERRIAELEDNQNHLEKPSYCV